MINKFDSTDYEAICGVLRTLNSICRKFRYAFSSDVEQDLVYVVKELCLPLLTLFKRTMAHAKEAIENPQALQLVNDLNFDFFKNEFF